MFLVFRALTLQTDSIVAVLVMSLPASSGLAFCSANVVTNTSYYPNAVHDVGSLALLYLSTDAQTNIKVSK